MTKLVLIILDGFGAAPRSQQNPASHAATPVLDDFERRAFGTTLQASGIAVGLPWGEPGNSEVGHLAIGSGRILYHHLPRIITAIQDGSFFTNPALKKAFTHARENGGKVHLMGLVSSGSVHAYVDHLYALFEMAEKEQVKVALHIFTDGRDSEPKEAGKFIPQIDERIQALGVGNIASICGRDYPMDRDGHWEKTEAAYRLITQGVGKRASSVKEAIEAAYAEGLTDSHIPPTAIGRGGDVLTTRPGDALIFMNFREDSARQLAEAFGTKDFSRFERHSIENLLFTTMTQYSDTYDAEIAFPPIMAEKTFGEVIANAGLSQLRVAETDKYAHVTYFFNGLREKPFVREERTLIPSVSAASEDEVPEMRAAEIADAVVHAVETGSHDVIIVNLANADMVGHTGNFEACAKAIEAIDSALGRIITTCEQQGVPLIVTADHGNVEHKIDLLTGRKLTEHTLNPVPFLAIGPGVPKPTVPYSPEPSAAAGILIDVAPTALKLIGLDVPEEMTGRDLFAIPQKEQVKTLR